MNFDFIGHIVAIASNCGLFGLSHLGDYCASKFAIIGKIEEEIFWFYLREIIYRIYGMSGR